MRAVGLSVMGLVAGLVAGILLSELIGIVSYLASGRLVGVRYLPVYLGIAGAVAAPLVHRHGGEACEPTGKHFQRPDARP
jgi:hypothetical protein